METTEKRSAIFIWRSHKKTTVGTQSSNSNTALCYWNFTRSPGLEVLWKCTVKLGKISVVGEISKYQHTNSEGTFCQKKHGINVFMQINIINDFSDENWRFSVRYSENSLLSYFLGFYFGLLKSRIWFAMCCETYKRY